MRLQTLFERRDTAKREVYADSVALPYQHHKMYPEKKEDLTVNGSSVKVEGAHIRMLTMSVHTLQPITNRWRVLRGERTVFYSWKGTVP